MSDIAISVRGLGKQYRIAKNAGETHSTLTETVLSRFKDPLRKAQRDEFWALKDVSFDVKKGDVVGIIGRNGAGKSTLLKVLSRITRPTTGEIRVNGRIGSLLEVGTGFHPELTGRENIYLNGAILGMRREEIKKQFDAIVDFSGVEKFLDTPVKRYSSGMYVRLAFAVAAHLNPEILIVDEVLAVGDAEFQKKCLGKMKDVAAGGRTVLFVSHNMQAVQSLCTRTLVLVAGRVTFEGLVDDCVSRYLRTGGSDTSSWLRDPEVDSGNEKAVLESVHCTLTGDQPKHLLNLTVLARACVSGITGLIAIDIADSYGQPVMQALPSVEPVAPLLEKAKRIAVVIDLPPLIPGRYTVSVWLGTHHSSTLDEVAECVSFEITDSPTLGRTFPHTRDHGFVVPASRIAAIEDVTCVRS